LDVWSVNVLDWTNDRLKHDAIESFVGDLNLRSRNFRDAGRRSMFICAASHCNNRFVLIINSKYKITQLF
jgi:hypothetical protein